MMRIWWLIPAILVPACSGEGPREIPEWDDTELDGDCTDDALYAEPYLGGGTSLLWFADLGHEDGALPEGYGRIITEAVEFGDLLFELELDSPDWPLVDFEIFQVGVVWLERCQVDLESTEVLRKADDSFVFDVELVDTTKNCDTECDGLSQALLMNSFPNDVPASVCRRVHAGCAP